MREIRFRGAEDSVTVEVQETARVLAEAVAGVAVTLVGVADLLPAAKMVRAVAVGRVLFPQRESVMLVPETTPESRMIQIVEPQAKVIMIP